MTESGGAGAGEAVEAHEIDPANRKPAAHSISVLDYLARQIVEDSDSVRVESTEAAGGHVRLDLHVADSDRGKVIGRRGRVAHALRSVVRATAAKEGANVTVDIVD